MSITRKAQDQLKQLMQDDKRRLAQFSISAIVFFASCAMLYWVNKRMPPSLEQELAALFFIAVSAAAFGWAILLQLLYIAAKMFK